MKYIGVDVGTKKVGIAFSDDLGSVAFPYKVVSWEDSVEELKKCIQEKSIDVMVIGYSADLDGVDNPVMREIQEIKSVFKDELEVVFTSEQFSTQAARRLGAGTDDEAAAIILQGYLDSKQTSN